MLQVVPVVHSQHTVTGTPASAAEPLLHLALSSGIITSIDDASPIILLLLAAVSD